MRTKPFARSVRSRNSVALALLAMLGATLGAACAHVEDPLPVRTPSEPRGQRPLLQDDLFESYGDRDLELFRKISAKRVAKDVEELHLAELPILRPRAPVTTAPLAKKGVSSTGATLHAGGTKGAHASARGGIAPLALPPGTSLGHLASLNALEVRLDEPLLAEVRLREPKMGMEVRLWTGGEFFLPDNPLPALVACGWPGVEWYGAKTLARPLDLSWTGVRAAAGDRLFVRRAFGRFEPTTCAGEAASVMEVEARAVAGGLAHAFIVQGEAGSRSIGLVLPRSMIISSDRVEAAAEGAITYAELPLRRGYSSRLTAIVEPEDAARFRAAAQDPTPGKGKPVPGGDPDAPPSQRVDGIVVALHASWPAGAAEPTVLVARIEHELPHYDAAHVRRSSTAAP